jgi:predicted HD phosphohydrolase
VSVDWVIDILRRGEDVYDEPDVDALSHALQCGAILLAEHPDDQELAVAGLLHDIGDILQPNDHEDHEGVGAQFVQPLFGSRIAKLVGAHVIAKRYLVATDPEYRAQLSPRSIETLAEQGQELDELAIARLSRDADIADILILRRADERAKDPNANVPGLEDWRSALENQIMQSEPEPEPDDDW